MNTPDKSYQVNFDRAMEQYADMVYRGILSIIGNREDARDAFQETFLKLVRYQDTIKCEEHLKAWLIRTATHCARTTAASVWNRTTQGIQAEAETGTAELAYQENPLLEELHKLPDKYAVVLYLHYYEEYSVSDMAKTLKKNENTIKTLLSRGRKLLRNSLEKGGFTYEG